MTYTPYILISILFKICVIFKSIIDTQKVGHKPAPYSLIQDMSCNIKLWNNSELYGPVGNTILWFNSKAGLLGSLTLKSTI